MTTQERIAHYEQKYEGMLPARSVEESIMLSLNLIKIQLTGDRR